MMNSLTITVNAIIARALGKIRLPYRARMADLNTATAVQLASLAGVAGEVSVQVEVMQQFGLTSGIPAGSQCVVIPLLGSSRQAVVVATECGPVRVVVGAGETCVYNQWGAKITLKQDKIIDVECDEFNVRATKKVTIDTKDLTTTAENTTQTSHQSHTLTAPALGIGGSGGGTATATIAANINQQGHYTTSGDVVASGKSLTGHTHTGVEPGGGTSGTPA